MSLAMWMSLLPVTGTAWGGAGMKEQGGLTGMGSGDQVETARAHDSFEKFCRKGEQKRGAGVPIMARQKQIQLGTMSFQVRFLASLSGLRIRRCHELWCRSQTWLRSSIAVAVVQAGRCNSNSVPCLGTSICCRYGSKKKKKKKKEKKKKFSSLHLLTEVLNSLQRLPQSR